MSASEAVSRRYDARRRQDAAAHNRVAMLRTYERMLFDVGHQATTIRAVAEGAAVSPELVYKTFGGKSGLLKALWDVTLAGDDAPVAMGQRAQTREVWATSDPDRKLDLYAGFVRGVHERLARLYTVLVQAGSEGADVLDAGEQERLTGVGRFVAHVADAGLLRDGVTQAAATDACWTLTATEVFTRLTVGRGWDGDKYQHWLAQMLTATLSVSRPSS